MTHQYQAALSTFSSPVAERILSLSQAKEFHGHFSQADYQDLLALSGLSDSEFKLALLPLAASHSHSPLSHFCVGAIVEGLSGDIYFGANIEFSGTQLGQTVHAEQSAISHAWMCGENGIKNITINYTPCGHCRQFMNELNHADQFTIQLPNRPSHQLHDFLPDAFGPADLDKAERLMDNGKQNFSSDEAQSLIQAAIEALNFSHAPYTHNFSGVAILTQQGHIFTGSYAENAAFNPSLPPLQVAINRLLLAGQNLNDISEVALAEVSSGTISHLADTQSTLEEINPDIVVDYISL